MLKDLIFCLINPLRIFLIVQKRMINIVILIIVFSFIAISPLVIKYSTYDSIEVESAMACRDEIMGSGLDCELQINDYKLTGETDCYFYTNDFQFYINGTGSNGYQSKATTAFMFVFEYDCVLVNYLGITIKKYSYEELNVSSLDFRKIMLTNYEEVNRFAEIVSDIYDKARITIVLGRSVEQYIELLIGCALIFILLLIIGRFTKGFIPPKISARFIICCIPIYLFSVLLANLIDANWIRYIGSILSLVYFIASTQAIVGVKQKEKEDTK